MVNWKRAKHEKANGASPPVTRHAQWCLIATEERCTCRPIPALQCNECKRVFTPEPDETPVAFSDRVQVHASLHRDQSVTFTQGRIEKTPRRKDQP